MDIADARLSPGAAAAVTALYAEHALGLVRLAVVLTGDRGAAEDIVQDAFLGLYRRWDQPGRHRRAARVPAGQRGERLPDRAAPPLAAPARWPRRRGRGRRRGRPATAARPALAESPEARALLGDEQRAVAAALRKLPRRQREAVVLRYYLDLSEEETAQAMGVSRGTVKSATHRALAAVGRILREGS